MLDTRFPRVVGDIGHPRTFACPVRYRTVEGASPRRVVVERDPRLVAPFVAAARELERDGVAAIATSCGFLALFQRELAASVAVPLWTSNRKSTRLNSSHMSISYAVFCLKKKYQT